MTESERGLITARINYVVSCAKLVGICAISHASVDELEAANADLIAAIDRLNDTIERVAK